RAPPRNDPARPSRSPRRHRQRRVVPRVRRQPLRLRRRAVRRRRVGAGLTMATPRAVPARFTGIGYTRSREGFPLVAIEVPVPSPGADQILVHVACSSLNPLGYKLADLNFFGRTPPVILGFDLAGVVVATGSEVTTFAVGDEVAAMADCNGDGGWATGQRG